MEIIFGSFKMCVMNKGNLNLFIWFRLVTNRGKNGKLPIYLRFSINKKRVVRAEKLNDQICKTKRPLSLSRFYILIVDLHSYWSEH